MFKGLLRNKKKGSLSTITKDNILVMMKPFVETDPTVPQHVKDITEQDILDWVNGFNNNIISGSVTGDQNKVLTLTKRNGTTLSIPFNDLQGLTTDDVINTLNFNTTNGVMTAVTSEGVQLTTNMDGRYALLGHTHDYDKYVRWGFKVTGGVVEYVASEEEVEFEGTGGTTITRIGKKITVNSSTVANQGTLTRTSSFALDASMNQKTIILNLSSDIQITIPSGLGVNFACNIVSEDSGVYYAELIAGAGTTLKAPHGPKLLTDYTCNILKKTGQEVFNAQGELTP